MCPSIKFSFGLVAAKRLQSSVNPKGYAVFVVEESNGKSTARERKINLGDVVGNSIAVSAGLQGGEKVIVRGVTLVVDSQEVKVIP